MNRATTSDPSELAQRLMIVLSSFSMRDLAEAWNECFEKEFAHHYTALLQESIESQRPLLWEVDYSWNEGKGSFDLHLYPVPFSPKD